jgi:hypothetical protein
LEIHPLSMDFRRCISFSQSSRTPCAFLRKRRKGIGWTSHLLQWMRVCFAEDQTRIFEEMRSKALTSDNSEAVHCLQYVIDYYPTGTKQISGSPLDQTVERARVRATADIIAHLRTSTGKDLGSSPEPWIQTYAPH